MDIDIAYLTERIVCTDEEKLECLETVKKVARAYYLSVKKGRLALMDMCESEHDLFFRDCLEYVMSGACSEQLAPAFEHMLAAGNYHGKEFLKNILICEGMLALVGDPGECTLWKLAPYFGAGMYNKVMEAVASERQLRRRGST